MRNTYKIFITFCVVILTITSCVKDKFFELKHEPQTPWNTFSAFELSANGALRQASQGAWGGGVLASTWWWDYHMSDVCQIFSSFEPSVYNRDLSVETQGTDRGNHFGIAYQVITACNDPLQFLENAKKNGTVLFPEITDAQRTAGLGRISAELHFMRAWSYFSLVQAFHPPYDPAGANDFKALPYKVSFTDTVSQLRETKIATTKEIYDLIQADLLKAKADFEADPSNLSYNKFGHPNYYTVLGLMARVYFLMGKTTDAETACTALISSGKYSVSTDPIETFNKNSYNSDWSDDNSVSPEVIWFFPQSRNPAKENFDFTDYNINKTSLYASGGGRGANWDKNNWVHQSMSYWALKYVDWMAAPTASTPNYTATPNALADKRYTQIYYRLEGYIPKPAGMDDITYNNTYEQDYKGVLTPKVWVDKFYRSPLSNAIGPKKVLMRLAEFYLTRSIIRFNKGDKAGAAADLKVIRDRAGLPEILASNITADDIHKERIKELTGEGDRIRYLQSLRLPLGLGDRKTGSPVTAPYSTWFWKIPKGETDLNNGYKK